MLLKNLIILSTILLTINIFSYCKPTNKTYCIKLNYFKKFKNFNNNEKLIDIFIDKEENKYLLVDFKKGTFIIKLSKKDDIIYKKVINAKGVNIAVNGKEEVFTTFVYKKKLQLEVNNKKINIKSNNTKSMLILKLNNNGDILNSLEISTNYGVIPLSLSYINETLYITGYYGGISKFFEKTGYEDGFLLALNNNLNQLWSKSFINKYLPYLNNFKLNNNYIYLKQSLNNLNSIIIIDRKTKKIVKILKESTLINFDVDNIGNIYLINKKFQLVKINKDFIKDKSINLKIFDYAITPVSVNLEKNSIFIKYIASIEYKKNIIISNYNLKLKNNWYYAILGDSYLLTKFKLFNKKYYIFGNCKGNLKFSDKNYYYMPKTTNFLAEFN